MFVVDSCDVDRLCVARQELTAMLQEDELKDSILLVFANKQDSRGAMNAQQVIIAFVLSTIDIELLIHRSLKPWDSLKLKTASGRFRKRPR